MFLKDDEWDRYEEILQRAQARWKYNVELTKTAIGRRIVGLEPPDEIVTQEDINYFYGRVVRTVQSLPDLPPASPEVSISDTQPGSPGRKVVNGD